MTKTKIPGLILAGFIAAVLMFLNACVFLGTTSTPAPGGTSQAETGTGTATYVAGTPEPDQETKTPTKGGDKTQSSGLDVTLVPLEMTRTAFYILIHGGGISTQPPVNTTPTVLPSGFKPSSTSTPTGGTQVTPTRTRTVTHPASWYWTVTTTRTPTRNAATLTKVKYVTYIYATRTGRAQTNTAAYKTYVAGQTKTANYNSTQSALTTLTRTSIAKTNSDLTVQAQMRTQEYYLTQTDIAKTAVYRMTQTAEYWPKQTDIAGDVLPTYVLTPPPTPTPNPNPRIVYTGNLEGAPYKALMIKYVTPSIGLWAFISGSYDSYFYDLSHDYKKIIFGMDNKLYILYPKDSVSRVDLLPNQDISSSDENDQAVFSPDGEWIVYRKFAGGQYDLYLIRQDGTDRTRLTDDSNVEQNPDWSPDGTTLILDIDGTLYSLDVSKKPPLTLPSPLPTPQSMVIAGISARFSPAGDKVVLAQSGNIKIATYSAGALSLSSWEGVAGSMPAWSSDGTKIIYVNVEDKISQVASSGTPSPSVISNTDGALNPHWIP